jgi:hypothetical protein
MRKNRFLTRLSSEAFVVVVATGAVLFTDGVSAAAAPAASPGAVAATTPNATSAKIKPSITLLALPSSVNRADPVTLTAKIDKKEAAGKVQFWDRTTTNTTNLGDAVTVNTETGRAMEPIPPSTLQLGQHWLTAEFIPDDPTAYSSSTSEPVTLMVTRQETILTESPGTMYALSISKVELAAKLTEASTGKPVEGGEIDFYGSDGQPLCQAATDVRGVAQCAGAVDVVGHVVRGVLGGYAAKFPGDGDYFPSTQNASGTIAITHPEK